jgi:hypothetical protein
MNSYDKEVFDEIMSEFDWEGALSVSALLGIDTSIDEMKRSAVQALTEFFSMDSDIRSTDFIGGFIVKKEGWSGEGNVRVLLLFAPPLIVGSSW